MAETLPTINAPSLPNARTALRSWALPAGIVCCLLPLFASLLQPVELAWRKDPNYSHGYLVPFICIALGMRAWQRAGPPRDGEPRLALLPLSAGILVVLAATIVPWPLITFAAFALLMRGAAVATGGRQWAGWFTAPVLFAFFMFPVPITWTSYMALWLQGSVSQLSAHVIDQFTLCWRTGTVFHLEGLSQPLEVGEECSGLRQLIGFLAFSVLLGLMLDRPAWQRLLLVVLAIPFAVLANVLRVLLMCYGALHFGTHWMEGWLHHAPAAFTVPIGFSLLFGLDYLLWRLQGRPRPPSFLPPADHDAVRSLNSRLRPVIGCLLAGLVLQTALKVHLNAAGRDSFPVMTTPLAQLPHEIGGLWTGVDNPTLKELRARLPYTADDLLLRDYQLGKDGPLVQIYAVYSTIGDDRKHHPEICIREVTGAPEELGARAKIALDADRRRLVQRFVFHTGSLGLTTVYYWHYTMGAPSAGNSFVQTLHQGLGQSPPSLTVQVSTTSADAREIAAIEREFLPAVDAILADRFLPPTATFDATRLPVALLRE